MKDFEPIIDFIRSLYPDRSFIPLHEPYFGGNEKKYLNDCIDSTYVSSAGKYVSMFEDMICDFTGAKYAIATVNGTAALHIALLLAGVERGDLVITQPLTFVATCNAINYCGADPVFIDIDRKTLGLSADSLENWLSENAILKEIEGIKSCFYEPQMNSNSTHKNTQTFNKSFEKICDFSSVPICGSKKISACVPMHTFGHPCEINRIADICSRYHIPVVEDAAEAIGSYYKGQHTGTFGKLGILSFNGNKTITAGGGGMILTNREDLADLAKHITTTAKVPHSWEFRHDMVGYNYRLPNLNAALGSAQIEHLEEMLADKRQTASIYEDFFSRINNIEFVKEPQHSKSNYWLNAIIMSDMEGREEFLETTNRDKIMTRPCWILNNKLEPFKSSITSDLTVASDIEKRLVNLPSGFRKEAT